MRIRGLLLDVEGVLVADKRYQAIAGAVEFVHRVRARGLPLRLITNNTTDSRPALVEKLSRAGFDFTLEELHTCTAATAAHLRAIGAKRCLVLGTAALRKVFADEGFEVADAGEVDAVVIGLDTDLTYARLTLACDAVVRHQAAFIALHRNRVLPDPQGRCAPSVGAIVEAVRYATQVEPVVIGKPSPDYFRQALDDLGVASGSVLVVSDDPLSDLAGAKRMGMMAAFVLSGKYADPHVVEQVPPSERPDAVVQCIGELLTDQNLQW
ncbi:MAG: HAD-IIA family hydrolase [Planctomycetota bacterium]